MKNVLTSLYFDNALMIVLLVESFKTFYIKKFKKKKNLLTFKKLLFMKPDKIVIRIQYKDASVTLIGQYLL